MCEWNEAENKCENDNSNNDSRPQTAIGSQQQPLLCVLLPAYIQYFVCVCVFVCGVCFAAPKSRPTHMRKIKTIYFSFLLFINVRPWGTPANGAHDERRRWWASCVSVSIPKPERRWNGTVYAYKYTNNLHVPLEQMNNINFNFVFKLNLLPISVWCMWLAALAATVAAMAATTAVTVTFLGCNLGVCVRLVPQQMRCTAHTTSSFLTHCATEAESARSPWSSLIS